MSRHFRPQQQRPASPPPLASPPVTQSPPELPLASPPKPMLAMLVIVTTPTLIRGRNEHAAMITAVVSDTVVDVLLSPAGEYPYPVQGISRADVAPQGAMSWQFISSP